MVTGEARPAKAHRQAEARALAADLVALAREPGITVVYQPVAFLDSRAQGTRYSSRAANALVVVAAA